MWIGWATPSSYFARCHAVIDVLLIKVELALIELEGANATGVHDLDGDGLRRVHGPADVILDGREISFASELAQEVIIRAEHHEGALVDDRHVTHFHVCLTGVGR